MIKLWQWTLGCVVGLVVGLIIGPIVLDLLHLGWYARQPGWRMDQIRVCDLSWAMTCGIVWFFGMVILALGKLLTR